MTTHLMLKSYFLISKLEVIQKSLLNAYMLEEDIFELARVTQSKPNISISHRILLTVDAIVASAEKILLKLNL